MVKMFDFGGQQLAYYLGSELGDLAIVTLNKYALCQAILESFLIRLIVSWK